MMHKIKDVIDCYVQSIKINNLPKTQGLTYVFKGWKTCYNDSQQWTNREEIVIFFRTKSEMITNVISESNP